MSVNLSCCSDGALLRCLSCRSHSGQPGPERTGSGGEAAHPEGGPSRVRLHQVPRPLQPRLVTTHSKVFMESLVHNLDQRVVFKSLN